MIIFRQCIFPQVNNASQIGLSYEQKLRDGKLRRSRKGNTLLQPLLGIKMTLSTNLDGTKLNEPGHKLGLALEMEA